MQLNHKNLISGYCILSAKVNSRIFTPPLDSRTTMYQLITQLFHQLPPEAAHQLAIKMLRYLPANNVIADLDLSLFSQHLMGLNFPHPLGLAAGFDKNAEVFDKLGRLGFSFLEVGSITPRPQAGNAKPRVFRIKEQQAIINRYGFNSKGLSYAAKQLARHPRTCITGINLGKNKDTVDPVDDFLIGAKALADKADFFTINVSSPNTPGLRDLQSAAALAPIIDGVQAIIKQTARNIPLFVKISPDMTREQEKSLVEFLVDKAITGIIISNTTIQRDGITNSIHANEAGGLSGPPLYQLSTEMLRRINTITQGHLVLIGSGGICSGADAYEKLCAGASLLQIYTAFVYQGPLVIRRILLELHAILTKAGIKSIREIIGSARHI